MGSLKALAVGLLTLLPLAQGAAPSLPLSTSSRWILDSTGARVKLRCVNWAGHMETHVPEGLHRQPISTIAQFIADAGFNCVRLTYSIDWALNPNETVQDAFANAADLAYVPAIADNMTSFYGMIVEQNPSLANSTVRDVYGDIIDALWANGVMTILDNHVSRAQWCCNLTDGNGWWDTAFGYVADNSRFFNTSLWLDGLQAVAEWAPSHEGVIGMSLRNEIRQLLLQGTNGPYADWYNYITQAAELVHAANPDVLIIVGGGDSATDLTMLRDTQYLDFTPWAGKHVWEFHAYSFTVTFRLDLGNCDLEKDEYGLFDGFVLTQGENYTAPLLLSEFGVDMTGGSNSGLSDDDYSYLTCLVGYMEGNDAEWALWAIQGSYYVRNGVVGYNETWGVLDYDWSTWRNPEFSPLLGTMWNVTQGP